MPLNGVRQVKNTIMWRQRSITPHQSNSHFLRHKTPDSISSQKCTPHSTDLNRHLLLSLG